MFQISSDLLAKGVASFPEVVAVYLFGSVARGEKTPESDVDLAILLDRQIGLPRLLEIMGALMEVAGDKVDVSILNELPLPLQFRVVRDGRLLYVRNDRVRTAFETRVVEEYLDFKPRLEEYIAKWLD
jgi:predicted nucleotidyltransferase